MRICMLSILATFFLVPAAAPAAATSQTDPISLTGLGALSVVVEELPASAARSGLTAASLQTAAERTLRQAGISLVQDSDAYLYIHVTLADPGPSQPTPFFVEVSLMQEITLPRNVKSRAPLQCPTWGLDRLGTAPSTDLSRVIGGYVSQFVDRFVQAYRSVNPK